MDKCVSVSPFSPIILIGLYNYSDGVVVFVFISLSSSGLDLTSKLKVVFSNQLLN